MIKGKFYTGLPDKMMNRSRGMDRQQTNFYWPDESDMEDTQTAKTKRRMERASVDRQPANNNDDVDINAKERFHKSLASGIEFFDNVDAKTPEARRRRLKKIDNVNLNNSDSNYQPEKKKLETFTSKIEFYDFVDDLKTKNNNKTSVGRTLRNKDEPIKKPVDSLKKRITFDANSVEKTKGILKNNDVKKLVNTPPRRGLMLSKSVENISKLAKSTEDLTKKETEKPQLSKIIRDVKNLNLSNEKPKTQSKNTRYEENGDFDDDDFYPKKSESNRVRTKRIDTDRYDDYEYDHGDRYLDVDRAPRKRIDDDRDIRRRAVDNRAPRRYGEKRVEDDYSPRSRYDDDSKYSRSSKNRAYDDDHDDYPRERRVDSTLRYNRRYEDDFDNRRRPSPRDTPPRNRRRDDYDEDIIPSRRYESDSRPAYREPVKQREYDDIDYMETKTRNVPICRDDDNHDTKPYKRLENGTGRESERNSRSNGTTEQNYVPPSRNRYQQNLKSNIFFDSDAPTQPNRPRSVRNSAVCRVGVGLPDI